MQKFIKNIFYESGKKNLIKYNSYENQLFSSLNYADFFFRLPLKDRMSYLPK